MTEVTEKPCVVLPHYPVMTVREVAKACGVAPRTVYKWFDSKRVQGYRVPGSQDPRIKTDSLAEWLSSQGYLVVSEEPTLSDKLREYASLDKHNRYLVEALYEAADELDRLRLYERACESMAEQFIHPKHTAEQIAKNQLGLK